ncbi:CU044_5270 family protein [Asanoa siamensis]|uniref:CU044_5270 family protein n=1 Tax=Asanoa siamensis TaxID=926357 RepID=A0ABQ4CVJ8_9ACTN|nr:CU044_5270 family protein [Asanoa siamensis]GIF75288.1 hypothetical protein Asi02nite_48060 [Asanoa siamensis]
MNPTRDIMDLLARSRPGQLDPSSDHTERLDEAVAAIMDRTATISDTAARQRRTRRAMLTTVGATAAAAAVAVVGVAVAPHDGPRTAATTGPQAAYGDANRLLLAAAERNAVAPAVSGRYLHLQTEFGRAAPATGAGGGYTVVERTLSQYWLASPGAGRSWVMVQSLGAKPATAADEDAWRRAGAPNVVEVSRPKPARLSIAPGKTFGNPVDPQQLFGIGNQSMTVAEVGKLPTDPTALREALLARFDGGGGDMPTDRGQWLLGVTASLLVDMPTTNAVRAAAFRLLADLPGVRGLGAVRDVRGRAGQAVAFIQDSPVIGSFEVRLIIDPDDGRALGQERRAVRPLGPNSWIAPGELASYQMVMAETYTNDNPPRVDATN